jgi:hypothetical protein
MKLTLEQYRDDLVLYILAVKNNYPDYQAYHRGVRDMAEVVMHWLENEDNFNYKPAEAL